MKYDKNIKTKNKQKYLQKEREEYIMNPALIDIFVEIGKLILVAIGEGAKSSMNESNSQNDN